MATPTETEEKWHQFEALRDDGAPARFRIRDTVMRPDQPNIFVVELPYPITDLSRLPDAGSYRRIITFEQNWLVPAANALGWTFVAAKIDDGSCFLYLYGAADPAPMIERLAPFDGALGFYDERDPDWDEYNALKELLAEANALADEVNDNTTTTVIPVIDETATTIVRPLSAIEALRPGRPAAPTIPIVKPSAPPPPAVKRAARGTARPASKPKAAAAGRKAQVQGKPRGKATGKLASKARKATSKAGAKTSGKAGKAGKASSARSAASKLAKAVVRSRSAGKSTAAKRR